MTKPTAEVVDHEGARVLRVDFNNMGVSIGLPIKDNVLDIAIRNLLERLAGTSEYDLKTAAMSALCREPA